MIQTKLIVQPESSRLIERLAGKEKGPTFVFFGGIHGNEPAGIFALEKIFQEIETSSLTIRGLIYGIRGNLPGISSGKRYLEDDLNRLWTSSKIKDIRNKPVEALSMEEKELLQLYELVSEILSAQSEPIYFVDIHTTSSKTIPFITINDALINRKFSRLFPVPVVLGIEEYLEGPMLSYVNEKGYVSLGFESGQHREIGAVENAISFIWIALISAEIIDASEVPDLEGHYHRLKTASCGDNDFYEVIKRHVLLPEDDFKMVAGFRSFEKVEKATLLAEHNKNEILTSRDTILFMPLYQELGKEGFFYIRKIPAWALRLSSYLRKLNWDSIFSFFPGISWDKENKNLHVNLRTARFMGKPFFHLFGYRKSYMVNGKVIMSNRELTSKKKAYQKTWWFRK